MCIQVMLLFDLEITRFFGVFSENIYWDKCHWCTRVLTVPIHKTNLLKAQLRHIMQTYDFLKLVGKRL